MSWILLTNDDGIDSPALVPFTLALSELAEVRVVVPDRERSWIGKAITRFETVTHAQVERDGIVMHTVSGFPADAVQIGAGPLFGERPSLVVSGVNVGFNYGAGYSIGSGTVGAAFEGWEIGIPSVAVSTQGGPTWDEWRAFSHAPDARPMWERISRVATKVVAALRPSAVFDHADIVSVNMPDTAADDTPWRIAPAARTRYGGIYATVEGGYGHDYWGDVEHLADITGTDVDLANNGVVAITPLCAPASPSLAAAVIEEIERG
jgi:5'-nucleotidase